MPTASLQHINPDTYQHLFSDATVPMLLIHAENGNIIAANGAALRFYGYSLSEMTQLKVHHINQLSETEIQLEMTKVSQNQRNYFVFRHKLASGVIKDVEVFSSPVLFNGQSVLFSVIHDITARKQAEYKLNLYAQIFTASTDMFAVVNNQQVYLAANQAYANMFGLALEQIIGKTTKEIMGNDTYQQYLPFFTRSMAGEVVKFERQFVTPEGQLTYIEVRYFPYYDQQHKQAGIVGVLRDISDRKKAEAELRLSAAVYQSTAEGIIIADENHDVLDVNPALLDITGLSKTHFIGRSCSSIYGLSHDDYLALTNINTHNSWRGELNIRCEGSHVIPTLVTINAVTSSINNPSNYVNVVRDISFYKQASKRLEFLAHHDHLTQLPNRILLNDRLQQSLSRAKRNHSRVAVIFIDVDAFKEINDNFGHYAGDLVLIQVAKRLKLAIRDEDTAARVSGDEFVVIIEDCGSKQEALPAVSRISHAFDLLFDIESRALPVTVSIGISLSSNKADNATDLIRQADAAMYQSKQAGKNQFTFFDSPNSQ